METEGLLGSFDVLEAFVHLWRSKFTGALRFERESLIKIFYFHDGVVVAATSNDPPDQVGEILKKNRKLTAEQLAQVQETSTVRSLGEALVTSGFVTRKELLWASKMQLIEMIASILRWPDGSYSLVENYLPKRTDNVSFLTQHVLLELILRSSDRTLIVPRLVDPSEVLHKLPERVDDYRALDLSKDADSIVSRLDGRMTVGELAAAAQVDDFSVYKLLGALKLLGMLGVVGQEEPPAASLEEALAAAPPSIEFGAPALELDSPVPMAEPEGFAFETPSPTPNLVVEELALEPPAARSPAASPVLEMEAPELSSPIQMELDLPTPSAAVPEPAPPGAAFTFEQKPSAPASPAPTFDDGVASVGAAEIELPPPASAPVPTPVAAPTPPATALGEPSLEEQLGDTFEEYETEGTTPPRTGRIASRGMDLDLTPRGAGWRNSQKKARIRRIAIWTTVALAVLGIAGAVYWHRFRRFETEPEPGLLPPAATSAQRPSASASAVSTSPANGGVTPPASSVVLGSAVPPPASVAAATAAVVKTAAPRPAASSVAAVPPAAATVVRTTSPPPAISVPPPAGTKYEAMGRDFLARATKQPASTWTIQVESVCAEESLQRALAVATADFQIWFIPVSVQGRTCFRVFAGFYPTEAAARAALAATPAHFREAGAKLVVVPIAKALR